MKKILVGVDNSPSAHNALRWATALADAFDAEVVVVRAFEPLQAEIEPAMYDRLVGEETRHLDEWMVELAANVPSTHKVLDGDPRNVLANWCESERPDLVVVGRADGEGPGLLHIGSVGEYLAHHLQQPLAVVPADAVGLERLVVGLDGSAGADGAARWAGQIAAKTGATVAAVAVEEPLIEWRLPASPDGWRQAAESQLCRQWCANSAGSAAEGIDMVPLVIRDLHPAKGILQAAADRDADLIVLGARGLGRMLDARIGGVALKVLHAADRTLLIVPAEP